MDTSGMTTLQEKHTSVSDVEGASDNALAVSTDQNFTNRYGLAASTKTLFDGNKSFDLRSSDSMKLFRKRHLRKIGLLHATFISRAWTEYARQHAPLGDRTKFYKAIDVQPGT